MRIIELRTLKAAEELAARFVDPLLASQCSGRSLT